MKNYHSIMNSLTQALGVLMVFVLIFPTALVNVVLFLLLVSYISSGDYRKKWRYIRGNPLAIASLLLFGLFVVGMVYSSAEPLTAISALNQYRELLLLPLTASIFNEDRWQQRAYYAFIAATLIALAVSYAMRFGLLPRNPSFNEAWVPFKSRIAYGFFIAYAIYLMIHHTLHTSNKLHRLFWNAAIILAVFNLAFMISGRTGYFVLLALLLLLGYQYRSRLKTRLVIFIPVTIVIVAMILLSSPAIQSRNWDIKKTLNNLEISSAGQRMIMWQTALRVIADHPVAGSGTGSFAGEYAKKAYDHPAFLAVNPHNEYLLITAQLGILGLAGFLSLFYLQWKQSAELAWPYGFAAQGLVLAMAVGCMFNSFLYDHGEGHFYAIFAGMLFSGMGKRQDKQIA